MSADEEGRKQELRSDHSSHRSFCFSGAVGALRSGTRAGFTAPGFNSRAGAASVFSSEEGGEEPWIAPVLGEFLCSITLEGAGDGAGAVTARSGGTASSDAAP